MFRAIIFIAMIASVSASESLDALLNASASFAVAIVQQLAAAQSEQSPTVFAEKTISYARAKIDYFNALRDAVPELIAIATGKDPRSPEVDRVAELFSVGGERQAKAADDATAVLLKQFSSDPDVEKATAGFDRAQAVEEKFHHDFDGVDFTGNPLLPNDKSQNTLAEATPGPAARLGPILNNPAAQLEEEINLLPRRFFWGHGLA